MFGKNMVAKNLGSLNGASLSVKEIFGSIQGEGSSAGCPAVFVRLAGCNLRCHFCDTDFESDAETLLVTDILCRVAEAAIYMGAPTVPLVVITGGEPLRQNITQLVKGLLENSIRVEVETAGTIMPPELAESLATFYRTGDFRLICSPKTPDINLLVALYCDTYKYVVQVGDGCFDEGTPCSNTQYKGGKREQLYHPGGAKWVSIFVQPMEEYKDAGWFDLLLGRERRAPDDEKTLANHAYAVKIAQRYGYRVSIQIHKLLGLP
ncbi:MAG: hypothetical protein A2W25_15070 [candidate division Zixibacteria bacterium RBG_16_53_22]|nr:MAG: hypothetical protein A2W25_15070 [candidate division Zixibacteria bacterium RBG_16_53_22]